MVVVEREVVLCHPPPEEVLCHLSLGAVRRSEVELLRLQEEECLLLQVGLVQLLPGLKTLLPETPSMEGPSVPLTA